MPWLVDLTGLIGPYGTVTGILNAFEVAPRPDAEQLPLGRRRSAAEVEPPDTVVGADRLAGAFEAIEPDLEDVGVV